MAQLENSPADKERHAKLQRDVFRDIVIFSQADAKSAVVLNFKDLQLLRIKDLQQKLFDHQMRLSVGGIAPELYQDALKSLDEDLLAYVSALRNYEYLSENTRNSIPKGFALFGPPAELVMQEGVLSNCGLLSFFKGAAVEQIDFKVRDWVKYTRFPEKAHGGDYNLSTLQFRVVDGYMTQERKEKQEGGERLAMAIFGGGALIGPTLVMTLHSGLTTSLVTVCLATLFFALALARFSTYSGKDILAATAAYAAVLVVFVGTSLSPSTQPLSSS